MTDSQKLLELAKQNNGLLLPLWWPEPEQSFIKE